MKLYIFEHCPYCVKALMVANYLGTQLKIEYLLNDDEKTPHELIGEKMVPILLFDDGSAMGESLDIAAYFVESKNKELPLGSRFDEVNQWVSEHLELILQLTFPRWSELKLPEFKTQAAIDYYRHRKEERFGLTFPELMARSDKYIAQMNKALCGLDWVRAGQELSWQDVNLYPFLRTLTVIKGLVLPANIKTYIDTLSERCEIATFYDRAL